MKKIQDVAQYLDTFAPTRLAEDWDNVGLLVGDANATVERVMTCLTVTPESVNEAIEKRADLIVSHHPLPFRPIKKLTCDSTATRLVWELARNGIAIYSPHTGFDSASEGINQSLAEKLQLTEIEPLSPFPNDPDALGAGRLGNLAPCKLFDWAESIKSTFSLSRIQLVVSQTSNISKVAVACGSGGTFLGKAVSAGCNAFVTGEATFHTCLEAQACNVSLILLGHFASERFAVEDLSRRLSQEFVDCQIWASEKESDPICHL